MNDAYGHMFGDQLLQAVALAILSCWTKDKPRARGDEFIVMATDTSQGAGSDGVANTDPTASTFPHRAD